MDNFATAENLEANFKKTPLIALCRHCGNPIPMSRHDLFCCTGCLAVNRLLNESGLMRYYDLKPVTTSPLLGYFDRRPSLTWLDTQAGARSGHLELGIEGIQCGACVWVIHQIAQRGGPVKTELNSALGRLNLEFDPAQFDVKNYLENLADLGYRVRPFDNSLGNPSQGLLLRLGVCAAITMNTMSFSLPFYLGLAEDSGALAQLLRTLSVILTTISVVYGGSYFFRRAGQALRHGVAHFDITISLGLAAAYLGSLWSMVHGRADALYLDSVNLFLTFMLLGRFLQERALLTQRRYLLQADSFAVATVTILNPSPHEILWSRVEMGQRLLLQPGTLCPCDSILEDEAGAEFDLASINGERRPAFLHQGDPIPAGARLLSNHPSIGRTSAPFSSSLLAKLLPEQLPNEDLPVLWRWTVQYGIAFVLLAAFGGLAYWLQYDPSRALPVFVAVLVVSCPCALGIAVPLARTLADQRLASFGLTVRQPGLLERLQKVDQIWLDKTGTLTLTDLSLTKPEALEELPPHAQIALMGAAAASRHPVSRALFRELSARGIQYPETGTAEEILGQGVRFRDTHGQWFLGRSMEKEAWAELSLNGNPIATFQLQEQVLQDAADAVKQLRKMGMKVGLLSGDSPQRVDAMAEELGLKPNETHAQCSPEKKAEFAAAKNSLMLGDGLNDGLALKSATVSGTPTWERSPLADQSDFSFSSGSLAWLPKLFETSKALRRTLWANLAFTLVYNVVLVTFALRGSFSPLLCAITMPASSLLIIGLTVHSLRHS